MRRNIPWSRSSSDPATIQRVSVDDLRTQLRDRGYLTHGIERWFALDPWSSRAFWLELVTVCAKAAVLVGAFGLLPFVSVMIFRNRPLPVWETFVMAVLYGGTLFVFAFALLGVIAWILKLRPALVIDSPGVLLAISVAVSGAFIIVFALWWSGFDAPPSRIELVAGAALALLWFLATTLAASAALLSFSIHELQRVPAIHQRSRVVPMALASAILGAFLFLPAYAIRDTRREVEPPLQVVTTPSPRRIALVAVDGMTFDILRARTDLASLFISAQPVLPMVEISPPERWATIGTGVNPDVHEVHGVEGVRLFGGRRLLQAVSRADFLVRRTGQREPLPPTVRHRDYVWEIFARRSIVSTAVNWWTTDDVRAGALNEIGQASIFKAAAGDAVAVDANASARLMTAVDRDHPQFATAYLPALDLLLNRLNVDQSARLSGSVRALESLRATIAALRARQYEMVLIGIPGSGQSGSGVVAATFALPTRAASPYDVAPTMCALLGFPASTEMRGRSLVPEPQPRITTFGTRSTKSGNTRVDDEYYNNLKSLGYIR